jgi:AcrR family transcriptional regulator
LSITQQRKALLEAPPDRRRRLPRSERRAMFLGAAAALIESGGLAACTIDAIAERTGVTKTLPYAYFPTRDHLLVELFEEVVGSLDAAVAAIATGGGPFGEIVERSLGVWLDATRTQGRLLGHLLDGRAVPMLAASIARRDEASHALWRRVVTERFDASPADAHVLAALLNRGATGVVELWVRRAAPRRELVGSFVAAAEAAAAAMSS